ncbi:MAG: DUF6671 family protein [Bacteroidota bacterium]
MAIATKHGKEKVIAPLLEESIGVECVLAEGFDTDELGTFTGEVERQYDPLTTLKQKCRRGIGATGCDLAVATEGSFGSHPNIPFVNAHDELVMLYDQANDLQVTGRKLTTDTNFSGQQVKDISELECFAQSVLFPSHALILKDGEEHFTQVIKGIKDWSVLSASFDDLMFDNQSVFVETDMRAMFNPTRMQVIKKATEDLLNNLASTCDVCGSPGFVAVEIVKGLPCQQCGNPTNSTKLLVYECQRCGHREEVKQHGKSVEDPMYCNVCNP